MSIITTIGSDEANSYASIAEADAYLADRPGVDATSWTAQSDTAKEFCLVLAADILNSFPFLGKKACSDQALSFPRITRKDEELWWQVTGESSPLVDTAGYRLLPFYTSSEPFETWDDVVAFVTSYTIDAPIIPENVKKAQIEIAFQAVFSYYITLAPMEDAESEESFIGIGKLQVQFGTSKNVELAQGIISKGTIASTNIVKFYLRKWLTSVRMVQI